MIRIGCLGAARIAPAAIVNPAKARGDVALAVVAARDVARARTFADTHGFERVARDYDELVAADDVDLVYNALPIHLHAAWTIRALECGKHVLCEKPLAMNAGEARAMQAAAAASGKRLIEAFHYRYHPVFIEYLRWIETGRIGRLQRIDAEFSATIDNPGGREIRHLPETGGGAFMDLGCYPLSWTLMTTALQPDSVTAQAVLTTLGVDERMEAALHFPGGLQARLLSSMAPAPRRRFELKVTGDAGVIEFHNPLAPQLGSRLTLTADGKTLQAPENRVTSYFYQLDAVVRGLRSGEPLPTEGDALLRQQTWIDAIYTAAGLGHLRTGH